MFRCQYAQYRRMMLVALCVSLSLLMVMSVPAGAVSVTFLPKTDYPVGSGPQQVAVADVNGDGLLDLVTPNYHALNVSVRLGNGDGTFGSVSHYGALSPNPTGIAVADLSGDGHADLAVTAESGSNVTILTGTGDGTFTVDATYPSGPAGCACRPFTVVAVDLNEDGALDLAIGNVQGTGFGSVGVLLNNGDGTFGPTVAYANDNFVGRIVAGDFNGDSNPDIAIATQGGSSVAVRLGDGSGSLGPKINTTIAFNPNALAAADFDGDGRLDLAAADRNSASGTSAVILLGNGDGTFTVGTTLTTGLAPSSIVTADFDGDGHLDLSVSNRGPDTVSVFSGNGDGTFASRTDFAVGRLPFYQATGDFNGDGKPDLAVANFNDNTVSVLLNHTGNQAPVVEITQPADGAVLAAGTINLAADFTDPDMGDTHICEIVLSDSDAATTEPDPSETIGEPTASDPGTCSASAALGPGVYTMTVTVTDAAGDTGTDTSMFVVYDPSAGFVTGGGWINSDAGDCMLNMDCAAASGKANFGFVSKYKKGATVPEGMTQFQFSVGGFDFHSNVYEWLVVNKAGANAQYKGTGMVNGESDANGNAYKFMLWAGDGAKSGTGDTFRIKIWSESEDPNGNVVETVVYDNAALGKPDVISGGSIVIHTK